MNDQIEAMKKHKATYIFGENVLCCAMYVGAFCCNATVGKR